MNVAISAIATDRGHDRGRCHGDHAFPALTMAGAEIQAATDRAGAASAALCLGLVVYAIAACLRRCRKDFRG